MPELKENGANLHREGTKRQKFNHHQEPWTYKGNIPKILASNTTLQITTLLGFLLNGQIH